MGRVRKALTGPWVIAVVVVAVGAVGFGLYWFQPWKLWQDETVQEALPGVADVSAPAAAPSEETSRRPPRPPARRCWPLVS